MVFRAARLTALLALGAGALAAAGAQAVEVYPPGGAGGSGDVLRPAPVRGDTVPADTVPPDTLPPDTAAGDAPSPDSLPPDTAGAGEVPAGPASAADTVPPDTGAASAAGPAAPEPVDAPAADTAAADSVPRDALLPDSVRPDGPPPAPAGGGEVLEGFVTEFTDLELLFRGRMEMGGEWTRFRPCDPEVQVTCDPTLLPQLQPDVQFGVQVGGAISDRIHVDVDYDETREFSATNDLNVYYEGREGELVQRLEVGDVTFDLPSSRFLTRGIPAGNFGFRADTRMGPLDFQTVWAEQNGDVRSRSLRLAGTGEERSFVQDDTLVLDDADYARGQFFFLFDPARLEGYPHLDVLALTGGEADPGDAPGRPPLQVYRFEADPVTRQQVEGYIQAEGVARSGDDEVRASGWFRHLQPGRDYLVHGSGLWIALRRPLGRDEMLAVAYVTEAGDTVGTYDPERVHNAGGRPELRLLKAPDAEHRPGRPTWSREMHQVYRVSGSDAIDPESVELEISLGELSAGRTFVRGPGDRPIPFLRLFGLDEQAPADELDRSALYAPARDWLLDRAPLGGTYLVFPTLEPFRRPPPVRAENLGPEEAAALLGGAANDRIYAHPDPFERRNGGRFRLNLGFRTRSAGAPSRFSLGAVGVRQGSERLRLGGRRLERGVDYRIDYDIGEVVLLDPEALFAAAPDAELSATWEQKQVFRVTPTSVLGLRGGYDLGEAGRIEVLGLRQGEEALVNRPTLGREPEAISLGGVRGDLAFDAAWLDDLLERVPGLRPGGPSSVEVRGELAASLPDPNTRGEVFLDDFDASNARRIALESDAWHLGSAPASREGAPDLLPASPDGARTAGLVWQHTWVQQAARGDSVGVFEGFFPRQDIDRQINVAGSQRRERGLLLTFGGREPRRFDAPRWRSITTQLDPSGLDLTRSEFLEFYVAEGDSLVLVLDLGTVSEDALFVDEEGRVEGVRGDTGERWGLGELDQEADPRRGEIWSERTDRRGAWDETCLAEPGRVYRVGDRRANCTRGNGVPDTEDLDGNGALETAERHLRYVVRLDGSSPFLARTREETGTGFRLFRIPLRGAAGTAVGGFDPPADLRAVKHLRLSVAGEESGSVVLARMRIVGSRWAKRGGEGVLAGLSGDVPGGGRIEVGPVSELSEGAAYRSPPGVLEQLDDPASAFAGGGVEFKERGLGVGFEGVGPGERAEVFHRFSQRPRDFMSYREARLWAVARRGPWGDDRPLYLYVKVGDDPDNFYLYRTRLEPAADPGAVRPADWRPEISVRFDRWMELRRRAELELVENPPQPGGPPAEVWSADSTYAVVLRDRGRAPNLAAVRELSVGVWNGTDATAAGEVWVNELRLVSGRDRAGTVGYAEMDLRAGDALTGRLSYADRGAFFRQLDARPTFQGDRDVGFEATLAAGRFAPASWGLRVPVRVRHHRTDREPVFLPGSDLRAARFEDLRSPMDRRTRVDVSLRREPPGGEPGSVAEAVAAGMEAGVGYARSRSATVTAERAARELDARLGYGGEPAPRRVDLVPGFLRDAVRTALPGFLERRLLESRVRWSPERIALHATYRHRRGRVRRYERILRLPGDGRVAPVRSPRESLETDARLDLRPFESLTAGLDVITVRDLLAPEEATGDEGVRSLIRAERSGLAGLDLGWETSRTLRTRLGWRPELVGWLDTDLEARTYYGTLRDPNLVLRPGAEGPAAALRRNVSGRRSLRAALTLDPDSLAGSTFGREGAAGGALGATLRALEPLSLEWEDGIDARFDRRVLDPGASLQLGWAGAGSFRVQEGDTASVLADRRALRAGGGLRLPLDLRFRVRYAASEDRLVDVRSARRVRRRMWPDLTVRVPDLPRPAVARPLVSRVTLSSGLRLTDRRVGFGAGSARLRVEESVEVPLDVSVSWIGGLTTRYRGRLEEGEGVDPTGETDHRRRIHAVSLSARFDPPGRWSARLERPVDVSVGWQYTSDRTCRIAAERTGCVPFVDRMNRSVNLNLDSSISRLEVGVQASWVDRRSFVGRRDGSTQFQVGLYGQFVFAAGEGPPPPPS